MDTMDKCSLQMKTQAVHVFFITTIIYVIFLCSTSDMDYLLSEVILLPRFWLRINSKFKCFNST